MVPATGTPVPGGLTFWQIIETFQELFGASKATVISMDVNEIVPQKDTLRQEASDCIEKIRQKQYKIKQEIGKIKELIKDTSQDQIPKGKP